MHTHPTPRSRPQLAAQVTGLQPRLLRWISPDLLALCARGSMAAVFFLSGRTKVTGLLTVSDTAIGLFEDEYHQIGRAHV